MPTTEPRTRNLHLTPDRFVTGLLAVEVLLWLSDRFGWLGWHKGYAVLTAVTAMGAATLAMAPWFIVALIFRRRFQFGIRSLLVLTVVIAIMCGWLTTENRRAQKQGQAVAWIRSVGGSVGYDWEISASDPPLQREQQPEPQPLRNLLTDEFFGDVLYLHFGDRLDPWLYAIPQPFAEVTDAGLKHIEDLPRLEWLHLDDTQVTDAGLEHLAALVQLRHLSLNGTRITDAGLKSLHGLPQLHEMYLVRTLVTDAGVRELKQAIPNCKVIR